jgi:epoxyqueuosine reductase QueG
MEPGPPRADPAAGLAAEIARYVRESPENRLGLGEGPHFDAPLVAFAAASDPLFGAYKEIIGPFHATPQEVLDDAGGGGATARTVICWALPVSGVARLANRRATRLPSREWAQVRTHGEAFNGALRRHVVRFLEGLGHRAVAPLLAPGWRELHATPVGIASTWSERHAAFAAGLGTFSLNDGLITARGIAHRLGTVVTDLQVAPTPRAYVDRREHCLHFRGEPCAVCAERCPVGAIGPDGHDKDRCMAFVYGEAQRTVGETYGVAKVGCGLCQTRVPCEACIPPAPRRGAGASRRS